MQYDDNHLPILNANLLSEKVKNVEYRLCGKLHIRAKALKVELEKEKKNFDSVIHLNIGDVQAYGQKPITFVRQVLIYRNIFFRV